jgi:spermidine/putrescine transport system permease protein
MNRLSHGPRALAAILVYGFLYAPLALVAIQSFNQSRHGGAWSGFTTEWYRALANNQLALDATWMTLTLAALSTFVSTILGTLLALGLRRKFLGHGLALASLRAMIVVPDIVMAVGLLMFYAVVRNALGFLEPGLLTMTLGHITFQVPFVTLVVQARLAGLDASLIEAARDLGATDTQAFRHVVLPLIGPGVLAGALLAFTLSLDDFIVSFFTTGPGATTLPILIYSSVKRGITPDIHALSTVLFGLSVTVTTLVMLWQRRGTGWVVAGPSERAR